MNSKFVKYWLVVFLYAGLIFVLSSMPSPEGMKLFYGADEVIHIFEYAVFGALIVRAFRNTVSGMPLVACVVLSAVLASLYGIMDEFHQFFVPTRSASGWDALFDCLGGFIGGVLYARVFVGAGLPAQDGIRI